MTKKKQHQTTVISAHPVTPADIITPLKPRPLKASPSPGGFKLQTGASDLGLVRGDTIIGALGTNGTRYMASFSALRPGTWSELPVAQFFCQVHGDEVSGQIIEDWRGAGAIGIKYRGGVVHAFWPEKFSEQDATFAVERSAAEFGLPFGIVPGSLRAELIRESINLAPFDPTGKARGTAA